MCWKDFKEELNNNQSDDLNDVSKIYHLDITPPYIRIDKAKIKNEINLQGFIKDVLEKIFTDNIFKIELEEFDYHFLIGKGVDNKDMSADIVLVNWNKVKFLDIEVKNDKSFDCMGNKNLFEYISQTNMPNQIPSYMLKQIIGYVINDKLKYGVLTSLNRSWFIKLETSSNNKITVYISDTIDKNLFLKAMNYIINLSLSNNQNLE